MTTKVSLTINAKRYDIDVEEQFARFLTERMERDFNLDGNNDFKLLLQAYVRAASVLYEQEKQVNILIEQLESSI